MKRTAVLALVLSLSVLAGMAFAAGKVEQVPFDEIDWANAPEYRIVPGDVLSLNFGPRLSTGEDLIREVAVRPDGRITVFPIGDVVAAGRTPVELQAELVRLLAADYREPRVTVEVTKAVGSRIHVLGRVKKPGSQPATAFPTLIQVIGDAGGFEDDAVRSSVVVMSRVGLNTATVTRVNVDRLLKRGGDVPLSRYDIVYVPRSAIGNLDVFTNQFFNSTQAPISFAIAGWELFNLDRIFVVPSR